MNREPTPSPLWAFLAGLLVAVLAFGVGLAVLGVLSATLRPGLGLLMGTAFGLVALLGVAATVWYFNPNPYPNRKDN